MSDALPPNDLGRRNTADIEIVKLVGQLELMSVKMDHLKEDQINGFEQMKEQIAQQSRFSAEHIDGVVHEWQQQHGFTTHILNTVVAKQEAQGDVRADLNDLKKSVQWASRTSIAAALTAALSFGGGLLLYLVVH